MKQRSVYACICMKEKINRKKEKEDFFSFGSKLRVIDRKVDRIWAVGRSVGSLGDRLVRRIYSFGESSPPPWAPRRQARSASRNRVESRSQDTDTSTFPRQFRSAGSTPLVHSCATLDCTWFAAHALSSCCPHSPLRTSRIFVTTQGLSSAGFLSTLSSFSRDQLFAQLHHFFPWHALQRQASFKMREIVHLQAGQCGNQIGAKVS